VAESIAENRRLVREALRDEQWDDDDVDWEAA
jgi:hypothetical protein